MYNLQEAYTQITVDEIFSKVSEYELWKYYCHNFKEIDIPFLSELYNDNNPDCRIFQSNNNHLLYKDFGDSGKVYGILDYIQKKYNVDFKECLKIIVNDFNIRKNNFVSYRSPDIKQIEETLLIKPKSRIDIVEQPYTIYDYNYWIQYHIPLSLLDKEEIYSCKYVYLTTSKGIFKYEYTKSNPIYSWKEYDINLVFLGWKVYMPYNNQKWLNSANDNAIQGIKFLEYKSNILFRTKSRKDILVLKLLNFESFSNSSENILLKQYDFECLDSKYDQMFGLLDNDETGIKYSKITEKMYNIPHIFVDDCKDISDYVKMYGLDKAKQMINEKING